MRTMQVRFPDRTHERLKELAQEAGVSLNSFIVASVNNEVIRQEHGTSSGMPRPTTIHRRSPRRSQPLPTHRRRTRI